MNIKRIFVNFKVFLNYYEKNRKKTAKTAVLPFFKTAKLQFSKSAVFQKP
jgi:hypothetical protein